MDPLSPWLLLSTTTNTNLSNQNLIQIIIIIACIIIAAFFAAGETAVSCSNKYKIEVRKEDGHFRDKVALRILNHNDHTIINNLIYINLTHIIATTLATILFVRLISNENLATILSTAILTVLIFLFSEILPKTIAKINPEKSLENLSLLLFITGIIVYPLMQVFNLLVKLSKLIFKVKDEQDLTEDDFQTIVDDISDDGLIEDEESEIIQNAVDFGDYTVNEVMTPADKMVCYNATKETKKEVLAFVKNVKFTRIPVYKENINNIIGVLHVKKYLLNCLDKTKQQTFKSILTKPLFVKSGTLIDDMFDIFQEKRNHIAFIKDDNDNIIGMVTMEDVVEKLVGDIDEKNPPKARLKLRRIK